MKTIDEIIEKRSKEIQSLFDECILHDLNDLEKGLSRRVDYFVFNECLPRNSLENFLHQELYKVVELLAQLRKFAVIESLFFYVEDPYFFWESSLYETLTSDEREKYYYIFDSSRFNTNQYVAQPTFYDDQLPYFSQIVQFIAYSRYFNILTKRLAVYTKEKPVREEKTTSSGEELAIKKTFGSNFNEQQIETLTACINEARIFIQLITPEITAQIFNCNLEVPLRVNNNRLLAYLFIVLGDKNLITRNWQSVCATNQLFLSSRKSKPLNNKDLSSAVNECRLCPPMHSEIIDSHIKGL